MVLEIAQIEIKPGMEAEFETGVKQAAPIFQRARGCTGTMPATAADFFGTPNAGAIYGGMIIAWSIGGVVGPLVTALLYEANGKSHTVPFTVIGIVALVALVLPVVTKMPSAPAQRTTSVIPSGRASRSSPTTG